MPVPFDLAVKTHIGRIGGRLQLPEQMKLGEFAWSVLQLDEQLIAQAVRFELRNKDKTISCTKGCGACCKQMVPVSPPEAFMIADVVASYPVERRKEILERMAAIRQRLADAGFNAKFELEHFKSVAVEYFKMNMPCPFLDDDACSVHRDRPFVCREFLVTSPAELCGDSINFGRIRAVPLSVRMTDAMSRIAGEMLEQETTAIPLVGAVEWALEHREEGERRFDSVRLMTRLVEILHEDIQSTEGTPQK